MPIKEETSTAGRKHPVPQNVMDVEFKVVGDLTVRQVMYLFGGATLVYILHKSGLPAFWRWIFMILSGGLAIAVAFIPLQERGLDRWLISFIKAITASTQRVWRKTYSPPAYFLADYAEIIRNEIITLTPAKSRSKLNEYLGQFPSTQTELDKLETQMLGKIQVLFSQPEPTATTTVIAPPKGSPATPQDISRSEIKSKKEFVEAHEKGKGQLRTPLPIDRTMVNLPPKLKGEIKIKTKSTIPSTIVMQDIKELKKQEEILVQKAAELMRITKKVKEQFGQKTPTEKHKKNRLDFFKSKYAELKSERKTILAKLSESTTKVSKLKTPKEKATLETQVKDLTQQSKELERYLLAIQKELEELKKSKHKTENEKLTEQKRKEKTLPTQQRVSVRPKVDKAKARKPLETSAAPKYPEKRIVLQKKEPAAAKPQEPKFAKAHIPENFYPNVIHGIVKGSNGELLENAVVIIKDAEGDVVRALKTNKLGQFKTQTAVPNGSYTLEIIKGGEKFDIISVKAQGEPLQSIKLVGKE